MKNEENNSQHIYEVISSDLRTLIFSGKLNPGDMLSSENELAKKYGTSRVTVRKGLEQLEHEGLIYSRPQRGYFVSDPQHDEFMLNFTEDIDNTWSQIKDVSGILPNEEIQDALQIDHDKKVIEVSRITYDGDIPIALDIKYLPYDRAYPSVESEINYAVFPEITAAKVTPFDYYTKMVVQAVKAKGEVAKALECDEDEPLLLILRYFIQRNGNRLGYSKHYVRQPYGKLTGISGYADEQ